MTARSRRLARTVGLPGAVLLGLGSMVGTGVYAGLGLAFGEAGWWALAAIGAAAGLALLNALSSARLAAAMPESGGTYVYAGRLLGPGPGFAAGWLFLCAKTASAAAAGHALAGAAIAGGVLPGGHVSGRLGAAAIILVITGATCAGLRRSVQLNLGLLVVAIGGLVVFCAVAPFAAGGAGFSTPVEQGPVASPLRGFLAATALAFVAFTGYGRLATLGEEVRDPRRTIPRAIVATLAVVTMLYLVVGAVAAWSVGPAEFGRLASTTSAPLVEILGDAPLRWVVAAGALAALVGVVLNLVLGLSRVWLAMGRKGDAPRRLAELDQAGHPTRAVLVAGLLAAAMALLLDFRASWSFSAFTVLLYYGLTNAAALRLPRRERLHPRWVAAAGLAGCLGIAPALEWRPVVGGAALLICGFLMRALLRRART